MMINKFEYFKHSKRYVLIVKEWWMHQSFENKKNENILTNEYKCCKKFIEEFDTLEDMESTIKLYKEVYKDIPRPTKLGSFYINKNTGKEEIPKYWSNDSPWIKIPERFDFSNGERWWGYMTIDFLTQKILDVKGDKLWDYTDPKHNLKLMDKLFRVPGDVPEYYNWDDGEYEGWLQFKWGDHKNSLDYIEPVKNRKVIIEDIEEATEEDLAKYVTNYSEENDEQFFSEKFLIKKFNEICE